MRWRRRRVNTAGRMLAWGAGWTVGAASAGALASVIRLRPTLHAVTCVGLLAVLVAWTSPLRGDRATAERDTAAV